jgi:tRNA(Ile)-lysidine synthase
MNFTGDVQASFGLKLSTLDLSIIVDSLDYIFLQQLNHHALTGQRILCTLSGGADSVALFRLLMSTQKQSRINVFVLHINHQLRGPESIQEAEWVRDLCAQWLIPLKIVEWTEMMSDASVGEEPVRVSGMEEKARNFRYAHYELAAREWNCSHVLMAHHANDQVETVLHRLFRGTGLTGIAGIPDSRPLSPSAPDIQLVRPLLSITKHELLRYLNEHEQGFCQDSSNSNSDYTRNFIRQELIPTLESRINPRVTDAILRLAEQAGQWNGYLQQTAQQSLATCMLDLHEEIVRLDRVQLHALHPMVLREVWIQLWKMKQWPLQGMNAQHYQQLLLQVTGQRQSPVNLPGNLRVVVRGNNLSISQLAGKPLVEKTGDMLESG